MAGLIDGVRRANRPGPPEHSVTLRVAAAGAVVTGISACATVHELSPAFAVSSVALVVLGNLISYQRRARPIPLLKLALALAMLGSFVWFFVTVSSSARTGDLGSVEGPLAGLFTAMQAAHSFDVPARRDLGFSLAGSATLMAVGAAQAVDLQFGLFVVVWAAFLLAGLTATWGSMAGGARVGPVTVGATVVGVVALAGAILAVLPPPSPASGLVTPSALGGGGASPEPSRAVPDTHPQAERPASPSGPTGVGGFLGFAGPLDTAVRATLGNEVVFRVRAQQPTFWVAGTYDTWDGQSWAQRPVNGNTYHRLRPGPPYQVPHIRTKGATPDYQTFFLATGSNLVLHASDAAEVWYVTTSLFASSDGTLKTATYLGPGSVYTVLSDVTRPAPSALATANGTTGLPTAVRHQDLELPHPYPRVAALARRITKGDATTYDKVQALEHWIGDHTKYTLDIPPLHKGQDSVVQFLFHTRRGYCEQISTALSVMLRTLGIPAQEATGYVPGTFDPLTGLYEVEAKDAHAWVQVWFPGYGWQSFDPTADVPLANPSTPAALAHLVKANLARIPLLPTVPAAAVLVIAVAVLVVRRQRPPHWRAAVTSQLERAARSAGLHPGPTATLETIAASLDATLQAPARAGPIAVATERAAWTGVEPDAATRQRLVGEARRLRRSVRRVRTTGPAPGRHRSSPRRSTAAGRP